MTHDEMILNLQLTLDECIAQCEAVGLKPGKIKSISINTRYTRTAGMCKEHKIGKLVTYSIEVAFFTMKQSQEFINDTVMHEILHTIPGCFNHGPNRQAAATKINEAYGYKLSTTYNDANLEEKNG